MNKLIPPHGGRGLSISMLAGDELDAEKERAVGLKRITISHRAMGDLLMIGNGGFSPLTGFMTKADWRRVCEEYLLADGIFWPIPITLDIDRDAALSINEGDDVALINPETAQIVATMSVFEKFRLSKSEKKWECEKIFMGEGIGSVRRFWDLAINDHPGVRSVMNQHEFYLAGPIKVLNKGEYEGKFDGLFLHPEQTRKIFESNGWSDVAALQLRNPMHRSHEYLCKTALEVCDGVYIHSLVGKLKPGDLPASVRVRCIEALLRNYFVTKNVVHGVYPLDMRYAGPREALLHATFRQNYGCSKMIIGRDHAGVGEFYAPFEAQKIFDMIPQPLNPGHALLVKPIKIDVAFYCTKCDGMASSRTCPHGPEYRVSISGTRIRKLLSGKEKVSSRLVRPEVCEILREYYESLPHE